MALIGKIRKHFWFVLLLLGLALASFILMDMTSSGNSGGATNLTLGSVAGEKIDYRAFQQTEQAYYRNAAVDPFVKRKTIWDFYIEKALLMKEGNALGLNISKDELMDLQFGAKQSSVITSNWTNPQTGQVDQAQLATFKKAIEDQEPMNPEFRAYWAEQEKQIIKQGIQDKLNNIVSKSIFTPTWMAEESFTQQNTKVDINYVKIPFDKIDGAGITASDADISSYIASKKSEYKTDEQTRVIQLASFEVVPSAADSAAISGRVADLKSDFASAANDSTYALTHNGTYTHIYTSLDKMPATLRSNIQLIGNGQVYGPFVDNGQYKLAKLLDRRSIPDTVAARHILRRASRDNAGSIATAQAYVDSLRTELNRGASWDEMAAANSEDSSNSAKGGDLGKFTQETMVPEFAQACFVNGQPGSTYSVVTEFGVHLIKVDETIYNNNDDKYKVALIGEVIKPSEDTEGEVYDQVAQLIPAHENFASLEAAIANMPNASTQVSKTIKRNDYSLGTLGAVQSSRDIIQWAFNESTEMNELSPTIYRYTDKVNYYDNKYVVASLKSILPAGLPTADAIRSEVESAVINNKKAKAFAAGLSVTNLNDIAASNGVEVSNAADIGMKTSYIPGIGNEPEVLGKAFKLGIQAISKPIVGNTGVYVIQPLSKVDAPAPNVSSASKEAITTTTKSQVAFKLMKGLRDRAKIKDERHKFF